MFFIVSCLLISHEEQNWLFMLLQWKVNVCNKHNSILPRNSWQLQSLHTSVGHDLQSNPLYSSSLHTHFCNLWRSFPTTGMKTWEKLPEFGLITSFATSLI